MFKLHKPHLSGSIHSGHFMVSRLDDDDEDDNNDPADDSSESERDNANSVEIDVNNPESVVDATNNLEINYQVDSPSAKNEQLTSWNDLDRPAKHSQKQHQYLTYYTNSCCEDGHTNGANGAGGVNITNHHANNHTHSHQLADATSALTSLSNHHTGVIVPERLGASCFHEQTNKDLLARGINSHLNHLHQHHHIQDNLQLDLQEQQQQTLQFPHHYQQQFQHQHAVTIDTSLKKLLECMSLYYCSKLTSPKWKSFKGLKLRLKYKIRLNNLIWRAWFLQCIRGRRPPGCQFTAPVETDVHKKSETHVLEGKYWKRKEKAIVDEYKKWRIFHKQKSQMHCFRPSSFDWDSRASNLASSSMCGPDYHFYPDYDMNMSYNLDDLPMPMLDDLETSETDHYYQSQPSLRMIEPPVPHQLSPQQQQQPQLHHLQQQQQQQQQQQLAQMQVTLTNNSNNSQQALSLKREPPIIVTSSGFRTQPNHQHQIQPNFSQQQLTPTLQHPCQNSTPTGLPFNFDPSHANPLYLQLNDQLQQHQQHQQQQQQQQQHQQSISPIHTPQSNQQNVPMSLSHDLYPLDGSLASGGASNGGGSASSASSCSNEGGGRNEQRRVCHINAEQKRRCNIKNGFDTLKSILPSINQNANVKISKASMLQKAAQHISLLSNEQKQQMDEIAMLKQQIEGLKQTISTYQCQLPASGVAVGCPGSTQAREMLQDYVRTRTLSNWKFWIFSLLIEPLFETYYNSVSTNSLEDSCKTIFTWLDRSCGLVSLRQDVLRSLTFLSTSTNILSTPQTLPTEAVQAVRCHPQPSSVTVSSSSGPPTASTSGISSSIAAAAAAAAAAVASSKQQRQLSQTMQNPSQLSTTSAMQQSLRYKLNP